MIVFWSSKFKVPSSKKPLCLLPAAVGVLLVACCFLASLAGAERTTLTVLATADLHGNIYPFDDYVNRPANRGLAKIAHLVGEIRRTKPNALLVDCGDTIEGSALEYAHQRAVRAQGAAAPPDPMMKVMNYLRYNAMVVGNHEFNFGLPVLFKAQREADFPWLAANITPAATEEEALALRKRQYGLAAERMGERTFEPMLLEEVNGVQVAVIGLTTPAIPYWELPEHIRGYRFEPASEAARFWVRHAREIRRADLVILAVHSGLERDPETGAPAPDQLPGENAVYQLAMGTRGVDAIVFGHTHRELPQLILNGVLLAQPKNWGQSLAELTFVLERENVREGGNGRWKVVEKSSRTIPVTDATPADPQALALARSYHEAAQLYLDGPVATLRVPLDGALGRVMDTAALDAIHEVQLAAAKADVSLAPLFYPSVYIPKGPVTVRQLAALYIYYNTLVAVETSGRALKEALEHAARFYNQYRENGSGTAPGPLINPDVFGYNYDTAAGVTYRIDLTRPVGQRIVDLRFRGRPLEPGRKLRLALSSYRKSGGGGYAMFRNAPVLWQSSEDIRQLMIDHYTRKKVIEGRVDHNWEVVPEAARRALIGEAQKAVRR